MVQLAIQDILDNIHSNPYVVSNCKCKQATGPLPWKLCTLLQEFTLSSSCD